MYDSIATHANTPGDAPKSFQHLAVHPASGAKWYAVWIKSRQEKAAAARLSSVGVPHYLPLCSELRQWSDRKQNVQVPLFTGYLFVNVDVLSSSKLEVLKTPAVIGLVGNSSGPLPIPNAEIDLVKRVLQTGRKCTSVPLFHEGERVRIVRGPLEGIEGCLIRYGAHSQLTIAVEMIRRSVAVTVSEDDVQSLSA